MADWDADDFEPDDATAANAATGTGTAVPAVSDKWAGEDVEDDVKDTWDDEDDDKDSEEGDSTKAVQVKKKKPLKDRIAEREAKKKLDAERKQKQEEEARKGQSSEEALAEKLRQLKLQEDSDLELAKEAFGVDGAETSTGTSKGVIDAMEPSCAEDFEQFAQVLRDKITKFETSIHYVTFLENLYRDLSVSLEPEDLKKLGSTLNTLANEKAKVQKGKTKKGKQKAKLHVGKADKADNLQEFDDFGPEFDDFL